MSTVDAAINGERTKFKAIVKHIHSTVAASLGKPDHELADDQLKALAAIAESSKLTPTRPDRRFPNTNQVNNCWCARAFRKDGGGRARGGEGGQGSTACESAP
jgi:hypothetical protein